MNNSRDGGVAGRRYELIEAIAEHAKGWLRYSRTNEAVPGTGLINEAIEALIAAVREEAEESHVRAIKALEEAHANDLKEAGEKD